MYVIVTMYMYVLFIYLVLLYLFSHGGEKNTNKIKT